MTGSPGNQRALAHTVAALKALGFDAQLEPFKMPGWVRGQDEVTMLAPIERPLRVASLSYTQPHAKFEAEVIDIGDGRDADFANLAAEGKIGLLAPNTSVPRGQYETAAVKHGMRGILFIDRVAGGQLLARTGSFTGEPLRIPVYSITQEEGNWIGRLLKRGEKVRVSMVTRSHCEPIESANIVVTLPGRSPDLIVVGAHFDSWDLGQGAMDNGIGTAQLYLLAQLIKKHAPQNLRTLRIVWFNGEEQGLWGSSIDAHTTRNLPIAAMINLDMVGFPLSVNSLGYDDLLPLLEAFNASLGDRKLKQGVGNVNWFGSDHTSFQLKGVRAITFGGLIPPESVRYYHDLADTIDKVDPRLIPESVAAIAALTYRLLNEPNLPTDRLSERATEALFRKFALETRMKGVGVWPFQSEAEPAPAPVQPNVSSTPKQ
jgi:Iap family predicted aminopeptidase